MVSRGMVKTEDAGRRSVSRSGGGIRPGGITMRSNVVNINETKVISVFFKVTTCLREVGGDGLRDY